jgi:Na+/melibiose symporter-like transporter
MPRSPANRWLRLYLFGNAFSTFGDFALFLAVAIWVKSLTGSTSEAGLVMFAFAAGRALLPLSGVLVDRVRRRPLLIVTNLLSAAIVLLLLLVHGRNDVPLIYVVMVLYGAAGSVTGPAQSALLPAIVPEAKLAAANGMIQSLGGLLRAFSPVVGAGLFASLGGGSVAVIDAVTFLAAAAAVGAITVPEPAPRRRAARWRAELTSGVGFIVRSREARQFVIACALVMGVIGFFETVVFALVTVGLHKPATFVAVLSVTQAAGTIAGGVTAGGMVKRLGEGPAAALGLFLAAACSGLLIVAVLPVTIVAMLGLGASIPWLIVGVTTALQRGTPSGIQGRVFAAFEFAITVPQTLSIALGAGLITVFSYQSLLGATAVVTFLAALFLAWRRDRRTPGKPPAEHAGHAEPRAAAVPDAGPAADTDPARQPVSRSATPD